MEMVKGGQRECAGGRGGGYDSFSAARVKGFESSEKIWFCDYESSIWGAIKGKMKEMPALYREIGERFRRWIPGRIHYHVYEDAERYFGRKADRNRKIYNGMLKTYYYQFLGPKPPRKHREER